MARGERKEEGRQLMRVRMEGLVRADARGERRICAQCRARLQPTLGASYALS